MGGVVVLIGAIPLILIHGVAIVIHPFTMYVVTVVVAHTFQASHSLPTTSTTQTVSIDAFPITDVIDVIVIAVVIVSLVIAPNVMATSIPPPL